jgi:hypothetical protein
MAVMMVEMIRIDGQRILMTGAALGISLGFNSGLLCLSLSPIPGSSVEGNVVQYRHNTVRHFPRCGVLILPLHSPNPLTPLWQTKLGTG